MSAFVVASGRVGRTATAGLTVRRKCTSSSTPLAMTALPPKPRREESRGVLAGIAASPSDPIRQSKDSTEKLLSPPRGIPDPYGWMRDESRTNTEVLEHLKSENEYTTAVTSHLSPLREDLYEEMVGKLQETDYTVPVRLSKDHEYVYYSRTIEGQSYTMYCRAPISASSDDYVWDGKKDTPILPNEEIYLDVNELAKGKSYCSVGSAKISPSHTKLAYAVDTVGGETYRLYVKDLVTNKIILEDDALEINSPLVWGKDDNTLFYSKMDETHRPYQVYRRTLNDDGKEDELLFQEDDDVYWVYMYKSQDGKYLFICSETKETSEVRYMSLDGTDNTVHTIANRRPKVLYDVEHRDGFFWISSNVGGTPNKRLMTCKVGEDESQWKDVVLNKDKLFDGGYERSLDDVTPFQNHVVASGREGGIPRVWVLQMDRSEVTSFTPLAFSEDAYDAGLGPNYVYDTDQVLVTYDSLVTPPQTMRIPLDDIESVDARTILKRKSVPGYDPSLYACERTWVTARDGTTQIPVSMVYRKDTTGVVPTHLYGYGSYGACMEAGWSMTRLPLLDRGMVYVIAHVRGGGEMGRQWYEEPNGAKYMCKMNTFTDFVDVGRWLVDDRKITTPEMLSCEGRSAGGLLIGASINQAPDLFKIAILGVPFVDVACTMVDSTIPLTAAEWEEWGNPNEDKYHEYMLSYSPMENVKRGAKYPACLLTGGLHDPRVQFWEPAKFTATLRESQSSDSGPVCLKMDMTAGHFSASDRYKYLKELSFDYAFMLDQLGLTNVDKK